jgi:hypothetical protein
MNIKMAFDILADSVSSVGNEIYVGGMQAVAENAASDDRVGHEQSLFGLRVGRRSPP